MEIIFMGQWASAEAILIFLILGIFLAFVLHDGFHYMQNTLHLFIPKTKPQEEVPPETLGVLTVAPASSEPEATMPSMEELTVSGDSPLETPAEEASSPETPEESKDNPDTAAGVEEMIHTESDENTISEESIVPPELQVPDSETVPENTTSSSETTNTPDTTEDTNPEQGEEIIPLELPSESLIVEKAIANTVNPDDVVMPELIEPIKETEPENLDETEEEDSWETLNETSEDDWVEPQQESPLGEIQDTPQETPNPEPSSEINEPEEIPQEVANETSDNSTTESTPSTKETSQQVPKSSEHSETLFAITNNVRTLIARGQTLEARWLIIQWLALNKNHRELNMMLAGLYEQDHHFEKAEYIYKDLAVMNQNDIEILEKLGNVLIIQRRYEIALEMYKKIISLTWETEGTLYILSHLAKELEQFEIAYDYTRKYQKQWPNNPEILTILAQAEVALGNRKDAIQTLIKLKNLTPYNQEISDMIQKLVLEEELAGNFNSTQQ